MESFPKSGFTMISTSPMHTMANRGTKSREALWGRREACLKLTQVIPSRPLKLTSWPLRMTSCLTPSLRDRRSFNNAKACSKIITINKVVYSTQVLKLLSTRAAKVWPCPNRPVPNCTLQIQTWATWNKSLVSRWPLLPPWVDTDKLLMSGIWSEAQIQTLLLELLDIKLTLWCTKNDQYSDYTIGKSGPP